MILNVILQIHPEGNLNISDLTLISLTKLLKSFWCITRNKMTRRISLFVITGHGIISKILTVNVL